MQKPPLLNNGDEKLKMRKKYIDYASYSSPLF